MGDISMMPEGLVKISQSLYDSILPVVKTQVETQIKVRDLAKFGVTIQPAEYASWQEARTQIIIDQKKPLKAQMTAELGACTSEAEADAIREAFGARERALEHDIDHKQLEVHMQLGCDYNVRRAPHPSTPRPPCPSHVRPRTCGSSFPSDRPGGARRASVPSRVRVAVRRELRASGSKGGDKERKRRGERERERESVTSGDSSIRIQTLSVALPRPRDREHEQASCGARRRDSRRRLSATPQHRVPRRGRRAHRPSPTSPSRRNPL